MTFDPEALGAALHSQVDAAFDRLEASIGSGGQPEPEPTPEPVAPWPADVPAPGTDAFLDYALEAYSRGDPAFDDEAMQRISQFEEERRAAARVPQKALATLRAEADRARMDQLLASPNGDAYVKAMGAGLKGLRGR